MTRTPRLAVLIASVAGLAAAATAMAPEERTIKALKVELREGKGLAYKLVAVAKQGEKVSVLEKDDKGWVSLQRDPALGGEKGFVHIKALDASASKPTEGNLSQALSGRSDANQVSAAAAAKGIEPQTQLYAASKGWDPSPLAELKRRRESVTSDEFAAFLAALNPGK